MVVGEQNHLLKPHLWRELQEAYGIRSYVKHTHTYVRTYIPTFIQRQKRREMRERREREIERERKK